MTTSAIREKLHNYFEMTDDAKLQVMYSVMGDNNERVALNDEDLKQEVDHRYKEYTNAEVSMITAEESQKRIQALINKKASPHD